MVKKRAVKDIVLREGMSVDALVRQWKDSGGFTGRKLADAIDIVEKMERRDCVKFLSFPACIMATGTRGAIVELVRRKLVDVIVTTCGTGITASILALGLYCLGNDRATVYDNS